MIRELAKEYEPLEQQKLDEHIRRLNRMADFYEAKMEVAPKQQAMLFSGFVTSLRYSKNVILMYRKLTDKIAEEAKK